jgi:hypothetical protein
MFPQSWRPEPKVHPRRLPVRRHSPHTIGTRWHWATLIDVGHTSIALYMTTPLFLYFVVARAPHTPAGFSDGGAMPIGPASQAPPQLDPSCRQLKQALHIRGVIKRIKDVSGSASAHLVAGRLRTLRTGISTLRRFVSSRSCAIFESRANAFGLPLGC